MTTLAVSAFAKVNLCLLLGGQRPDGRHELVTLLESVDLVDDLVLTAPSDSGRDEVVCPAISGPNLVADALTSLRVAGWGAPPLRVEIEKRIPIAAGMGGGSADAGALLRSAARLAPVARSTVGEIAGRLGSDVPSQLDPGPALGVGAGELVTALQPLAEHALLIVAQPFGLSTADVYREADRLGLGHPDDELLRLRAELEACVGAVGGRPPRELLVNDLQPAAVSLRSEVGEALAAVREQGADSALVCGSGPTVIGLFWGDRALQRATEAGDGLGSAHPRAVAVAPIARASGAEGHAVIDGGASAPTANP